MEKERLFTALRILAEIIAAVVGTMLGVGLFCWLAGWRTYYQYGTVLIWFSFAIGGMGIFTFLGNRGGKRIFSDRNTQQTARGGIRTSTNQPSSGSSQSNRPAVIMLIVGIILFILGSLVQGLP